MRYRLRTLLILLAVLPPLLAGVVLFPDIAIVLAVLVTVLSLPFLLPLAGLYAGRLAVRVERESAEVRLARAENRDGPILDLETTE